MAKKETTKPADESAPAAPEQPQAGAAAPEGNSGSGQGAAPAETPASAPAAATPQTETPGDEIPEEEIHAKVAAGLSRDQAVEVITNQRAWDKQLAGQS
jgi:hypothetical protein